LHEDSGTTQIEGGVRINLPLFLHAQSRINREELKPLSLEAVLVGKCGDAFFYNSEPTVLWRSSLLSQSDPLLEMAATNNAGGGGAHRENVWSFVSDVSTGDEDHTLDDDFNENDRIFDTALKQGASFMQFPFSFKIPNTLPPSISPSPSSYVVESSCPQCTVSLDQQNGIEKPGLVKYPQYEVMAMLSFESFAVSAYQVVSAGIPVTRGVEDDVVFSELTKGEGTLGAGAFRYKYWDAPKYSVLNSQTKFDFKLQLTSAATDLSKIESVSMRPVYRYKHITAPEAPTQQTSHLYTPFQSTTQFPIRTINLSPTTFTSTTIPITLPTLPFPYPSAKNLGAWTLENALEVAITYRNPTNPVGSLSRIMKPPHNHAVHHAEGGYIQQAEGTRTAFLCIPVQVVHPYTPSPASPLKTADERQDLEALMDRVEASGVTAGGTVSCLFSAKKLVRIGLRDWVDAGRDDEISVVPGASGYMEEESGVAAYRSDAKPKMTGPVGVAPPIPPVPTPPTSIPTSTTSPAVTSPVIPTRGISAITVPAELNAPSIPARNTSSIGGVSKALSKDKNRKSIASSLNLTEITASTPIVIPKRAQSQPRKIFLDGKSGVGGAGLLPLTRGIGPGGPGVRGVGVNAARNGPLPPLPPGQQALPQVMASRNSMLSDANTVSTNVNSQWGSGIPGSINREQFEAASIGSSEEDIVASILDSNAYGDEEEFFSTNGADDSHISFHDNNEDQYGAPPQKKQVTFNETLEMFSAKSVAWTDSTISDYDPNNQQQQRRRHHHQLRHCHDDLNNGGEQGRPLGETTWADSDATLAPAPLSTESGATSAAKLNYKPAHVSPAGSSTLDSPDFAVFGLAPLSNDSLPSAGDATTENNNCNDDEDDSDPLPEMMYVTDELGNILTLKDPGTWNKWLTKNCPTVPKDRLGRSLCPWLVGRNLFEYIDDEKVASFTRHIIYMLGTSQQENFK
ncbi:hypothetical protein HDU99_005619, partial [Rhizoclosmatium hyalinum]